jgi:drug/metabolite transporter (DMT)-like permease
MRRVLVLAFIWGWSFLLIKVALRAMTPGMVAFGRIGFGLLVVSLFAWRRGVSLPRDRRMWRHFLVMGLMHGAVPFTLLAWSEQHITSALASVMNGTTAMFTALAAAVGLGERLRPRQLVGLLLGFVGVSVAAGVGSGDLASSSLLGVVAAAGMAACYGIGYAYAQRHLAGVPPMVSVVGQLVCASALALPLAVAGLATRGLDPEWRSLGAVVLLGVFASGLAYVLNYQAIAAVGPTRASAVTYLVPVVAVTAGVVFLDEPFRLRLVIGGALVALGIMLLQERLRRLPAAPAMTAVLAVLFLASCAGDGSAPPTTASSVAAAPCGPVVEEPLDPGSSRHVLPGAEEPTYVTDPPTSGAHRSGPFPRGAVDQPVPRPVQVGVLEEGGVIIQYRAPADAAALVPLAGDLVVVAPAPALPDTVVATAWRTKLSCTAVDAAALRTFVLEHRGRGPDH